MRSIAISNMIDDSFRHEKKALISSMYKSDQRRPEFLSKKEKVTTKWEVAVEILRIEKGF